MGVSGWEEGLSTGCAEAGQREEGLGMSLAPWAVSWLERDISLPPFSAPKCFPPLGTIVPWRALAFHSSLIRESAEMEGENVHR